MPLIRKLKKWISMNHLKKIKYNNIWNSNLLIDYYVNTPIPSDEKKKFKFLQKKTVLLLKFFFIQLKNMLL
jgi:hypothetical protein